MRKQIAILGATGSVGTQALDVADKYQMLTGGPPLDSMREAVAFVSREDGTTCELLDRLPSTSLEKPSDIRYDVPVDRLPSDSVFVVRTSALLKLEAQISNLDKPPEKPLERRERTTLLLIIAGLARLAKIDVTKPSSAAKSIDAETTRMGARVAARTIENHLRLIPEALETRGS